mgnify:CR=1 FL=1
MKRKILMLQQIRSKVELYLLSWWIDNKLIHLKYCLTLLNKREKRKQEDGVFQSKKLSQWLKQKCLMLSDLEKERRNAGREESIK